MPTVRFNSKAECIPYQPTPPSLSVTLPGSASRKTASLRPCSPHPNQAVQGTSVGGRNAVRRPQLNLVVNNPVRSQNSAQFPSSSKGRTKRKSEDCHYDSPERYYKRLPNVYSNQTPVLPRKVLGTCKGRNRSHQHRGKYGADPESPLSPEESDTNYVESPTGDFSFAMRPPQSLPVPPFLPSGYGRMRSESMTSIILVPSPLSFRPPERANANDSGLAAVFDQIHLHANILELRSKV